MVNKLLIIGVDGMDYEYVASHRAELPFLNYLLENNGYPRMRSVFPADTTPAWATIFTGDDPSVHGIINFVNVGDKDNTYKAHEFDDDEFKGKVFWDRLTQKGYKNVVLFPMNIKRGWDIAGLMITRAYDGKINTFPKEKADFYKPDAAILGSELEYTSESKLSLVRDDFFKKFEEEYRVTKLALETEDCDVFFSYFSTVDGIQHAFWRNCDPNHPEYPGDNKYRSVIIDMYKKVDCVLREFSAMAGDTPMLVISDHGHGARPVWCARINEMLKREGYLAPKSANNKASKKSGFSIKKTIRNMGIGFVKKFGLPKPMKFILKKIPLWKKVFVSSSDFDWDNTVAYLSDLSAMKNYSYGGIRVKAQNNENIDALCDEIISKLQKYEIDGEGVPAFKWIRRTNTLYKGEYLSRYPEIIFQLDERFGATWDLGDVIFEKKGFMHQFSPGAHRYETAFLGAKGIKLEKEQYELTDVYQIIMGEV
ncbi:MAG: alkaline phosphatase family protein [Clostridia bacterium]|nr:alkaline phosphatase family protein [Clostridia bacterium]